MAAALLGGLLVAGQAARLAPLLRGAPVATWFRLAGFGLVGLGEVLVPIAGLVGAALAFGRWRSEGHLTALWSLGHRPARVLAPVLALGLALGVSTAALAHVWGPRALSALAAEVTAATADLPWRGGLALSGDAGTLRGVSGPSGERGELWAVLGAGPDTPPTLLRAAGVSLDPDGRLALRDVHLWAPGVRAILGEVALSGELPIRLPGALRPPNTIASDGLDSGEPMARWSLHRRLCLAALAPVLAVLGALLGGALGRTPALLGGAAAMGLAYWGLRLGSVGLRAGELDPLIAGWLPLALLLPGVSLIAAWSWPRWRT
jgi:lipopolysaccharide export LptBFGC system permease protein LptF